MTTPPSKQPVPTVAVTSLPRVHHAAPPAPPAPVAARAPIPAAPVVNRTPPAPAPVITRPAPPVAPAPVARPIHHHTPPAAPVVTARPPVVRPTYTAPAPTHHPRTGYPQQRGYYQQQRPYYSQPNNSFLPGFLGGTIIGAGLASLFGRRPSQPSYGPAGAPYGQDGVPRPDSMTPSQFTSFMNAAIEGRENDRTAIRSGQTIPTTPIERQYFKQVVYAMAQRDGKQIDPQGMFTPEVLSAIESGRMDPRTLGSDLRHFSDSFSGIAVNARGQSVQSPLANDLYNNYDYLRSQYANEYRQSQQFEAQQRPPQQVASYQQPPAYYSSAPRSTIVPIFGMRL